MKSIHFIDRMKLKTVIALSLFLALSSGCNKKSDSSGNYDLPPPGIVGGSQYCGGQYFNGTSIVTGVYNPSIGQCVDPVTGQVIGSPIAASTVGFYSQSWDGSNYSSLQNVASYQYYVPTRNLSISSSSVYQSFLKKAMGVCDRTQATYGTASCTAWVNGGLDLVLQAQAANTNYAVITFRAFPQQSSNWYNYSASFPSAGQLLTSMFGFPVFATTGAYLNPLALNLTLSPINNSQGFEGRAYGDMSSAANRSLIQLQVATGKLESGSFSHRLFFEGAEFARGTFQRCQTVDCGTSTFFGN